jgi:triacylglycerol lipase
MGGVVARVYVQMLGGRERIRSLVTIGSPHRGSWWAYCNPFAGSKELRPGSELLSTLAESEGTLGALPLLAIHSPLDTSIIPYTSGIWARAMNKRFWGQFHPFMPYSRGVRSAVWEFLQHHGV